MQLAMLRAPEMESPLRKLAMRAALAVLGLHLQSLPAQSCERPTAAGGVHGVRIEPTSTVTYSDGYVTQANLLLPDTGLPGCRWPLVVFIH
ncbi:MAG: hypothetical protein RIT25_2510, partial [Planctomycetota bacterium]